MNLECQRVFNFRVLMLLTKKKKKNVYACVCHERGYGKKKKCFVCIHLSVSLGKNLSILLKNKISSLLFPLSKRKDIKCLCELTLFRLLS